MFILRHAELRVSNLIYTVKCILFMEFGRLEVKCQGITYLFWLYIATLQGSNTYLLVVIYRNRSKQSANLNNAMSHSKLRLNMQPVSKAGKCAQAKTWLLFYFWLVDKKRANKETNKQTNVAWVLGTKPGLRQVRKGSGKKRFLQLRSGKIQGI